MRSKVLLCAALACASAAFGKQPKAYQTGKILEMDSVECGTAEKDGLSSGGEMFGTGSRKTHALLCQEYLLEAEHVIYRIRPRDEKHAALLSVGQKAQFRIQRDQMQVRVEDLDDKEHAYVVVSMSLRIDGDAAEVGPTGINHLQ